MKILIILLGILNGGYMLVDGIFVSLKGKFIGPEKPGPWANLFYKLHLNVFKLGPLFIFFGVIWLIFIFSLVTRQGWAYPLGITICVASLWYLPFGTLISITLGLVLIFYRYKLGI